MKNTLFNGMLFLVLPLLVGFGAYSLTPVYYSSVISLAVDSVGMESGGPKNNNLILSVDDYEALNLNINKDFYQPFLSEKLAVEDVPDVRSLLRRNSKSLVVTVSGADKRVVNNAAKLLISELFKAQRELVKEIRAFVADKMSETRLTVADKKQELLELEKKLEDIRDTLVTTKASKFDRFVLDYIQYDYTKKITNNLKYIEEAEGKIKELIASADSINDVDDCVKIKERSSNSKKSFSFLLAFLLTTFISYLYVSRKNK